MFQEPCSPLQPLLLRSEISLLRYTSCVRNFLFFSYLRPWQLSVPGHSAQSVHGVNPAPPILLLQVEINYTVILSSCLLRSTLSKATRRHVADWLVRSHLSLANNFRPAIQCSFPRSDFPKSKAQKSSSSSEALLVSS